MIIHEYLPEYPPEKIKLDVAGGTNGLPLYYQPEMRFQHQCYALGLEHEYHSWTPTSTRADFEVFHTDQEQFFSILLHLPTGMFRINYDRHGLLQQAVTVIEHCMNMTAIHHNLQLPNYPSPYTVIKLIPASNAFILKYDREQTEHLLPDPTGETQAFALDIRDTGNEFNVVFNADSVLFACSFSLSGIQSQVKISRFATSLGEFYRRPTPKGAHEAFKDILITPDPGLL